ncbi:MAG: hypothetical protein IT580_07090, partial [Verrucomicrobiales bacterium]|nr:hypothetical protein [Verrucomicrobiales bacterium]
MKRLALCLVLLTGPALSGPAQTADTEFLRIYERIQQGDTRAAANDAAGAYGDYRLALEDLERFAKAHPSWNEKIIRFRLGYLEGKVGELKGRVPASAQAATGTEPDLRPTLPPADATGLSGADALSLDLARERARAETAEARASSAESSLAVALQRAAEASARIGDLTDNASNLALDLRQVRDRVEVLEATQRSLEGHRDRLESQRVVLEAKLKEALSPRPAALDPAELERVRERNLTLAKENEILKASLDRQMVESQRVLEQAR